MEASEESPETRLGPGGGVSSWAAWPLAAPSATQSPPIVRRLGRAEREALDSDSDSSSSSQMCFYIPHFPERHSGPSETLGPHLSTAGGREPTERMGIA